MKLVRYGDRGLESPGLIDSYGQLRSIAAHVPDLSGNVIRLGIAGLGVQEQRVVEAA